jgi:hypothetical protein
VDFAEDAQTPITDPLRHAATTAIPKIKLGHHLIRGVLWLFVGLSALFAGNIAMFLRVRACRFCSNKRGQNVVNCGANVDTELVLLVGLDFVRAADVPPEPPPLPSHDRVAAIPKQYNLEGAKRLWVY